jgi:multicomponent Na+:H+ antiporter subunit E
MKRFVLAFVFSFLFYLLLTLGSGEAAPWSVEEVTFGLLFSVPGALLAGRLFSAAKVKPTFAWLNPKRWFFLLLYAVGPFFAYMIKANFDVAYRVITGKIRPGIVKIHTGLRTDFGVSMLANSVTLTPGTLSVDVDADGSLYVHCINVKNKNPSPEEVCGPFIKWIRRITE